MYPTQREIRIFYKGDERAYKVGDGFSYEDMFHQFLRNNGHYRVLIRTGTRKNKKKYRMSAWMGVVEKEDAVDILQVVREGL